MSDALDPADQTSVIAGTQPASEATDGPPKGRRFLSFSLPHWNTIYVGVACGLVVLAAVAGLVKLEQTFTTVVDASMMGGVDYIYMLWTKLFTVFSIVLVGSLAVGLPLAYGWGKGRRIIARIFIVEIIVLLIALVVLLMVYGRRTDTSGGYVDPGMCSGVDLSTTNTCPLRMGL